MLIFLEFFLVNCNITVPIDKTFGRINNWIFKNIQHLFLTLNTTFSKKNDTSKYCHDKKNGRFVARILAWYFHAASYSWKIGLHICQEFFLCKPIWKVYVFFSHKACCSIEYVLSKNCAKAMIFHNIHYWCGNFTRCFENICQSKWV